MDTARRTMYTDRATGVWNRQKMESRFQELLESGDGFAAIVTFVGNLKRLDADRSRLQINAALKAMVQRITSIVGSQETVGCWTEDQFVALLDVSPASAVAISSEIAQSSPPATPSRRTAFPTPCLSTSPPPWSTTGPEATHASSAPNGNK